MVPFGAFIIIFSGINLLKSNNICAIFNLIVLRDGGKKEQPTNGKRHGIQWKAKRGNETKFNISANYMSFSVIVNRSCVVFCCRSQSLDRDLCAERPLSRSPPSLWPCSEYKYRWQCLFFPVFYWLTWRYRQATSVNELAIVVHQMIPEAKRIHTSQRSAPKEWRIQIWSNREPKKKKNAETSHFESPGKVKYVAICCYLSHFQH